MRTVFIRGLEATDKAQAIRQAIHEPREAMGQTRFEVEPQSFSVVPRTPFAYWVSDRVRRMFAELPPFEGEGRTAKQGLATADDFRFVRLWTEVDPATLGSRWFPFAKGGRFSPYYADVHLVVKWERGGAEIRSFRKPGETRVASRPQNTDFYFRPGLTWLRRSHRLCVSALPSEGIFSDGAQAILASADLLSAVCALANSAPFDSLVKLSVGRTGSGVQFMPGMISASPYPKDLGSDAYLADLFQSAWSLKRTLDTHVETSHASWLPALLQVEGGTLAERATAWQARVACIEQELAQIQAEIDEYCFDLYGFHEEDRARIEQGFVSESDEVKVMDDDEEDSDEGAREPVDLGPLVAELVSWCVGVAFGRFAREVATQPSPPEPEPFDPLPQFSPAMGLEPALSVDDGDLGEAPLDGILTDDPGSPHDLLRRVRKVFDYLEATGSLGAGAFEDAAMILNARDADLRRWLAQEFFAYHIKRYSMSRRKAPIYWQLGIPSRRYSVWLYYPRLNKDTLYRALNEHVIPKLRHEERQLLELIEAAGESPAAGQRREIADQEGFVEELRVFREELGRVAPLWHPDLDDGVIVSGSLLWRLFPHYRPWQKECKSSWDKLVQGEYDWAHLAMHLWPERVVPKCAEDPSVAIAHGLQERLWCEDEGKPKLVEAPEQRVDELVAGRSSTAVKSALQSFLAAPVNGGGGSRGRSGRAR
jgi:hypothetical protein